MLIGTVTIDQGVEHKQLAQHEWLYIVIPSVLGRRSRASVLPLGLQGPSYPFHHSSMGFCNIHCDSVHKYPWKLR
jgi:hypothetical protein